MNRSGRRIRYRGRRLAAVAAALAALIGIVIANPNSYEPVVEPVEATDGAGSGEATDAGGGGSVAKGGSSAAAERQRLATAVLEELEVKGRAPKTGYTREEFYKTWPTVEGCSLRQRIIKRELGETARLDTDQCTVLAGEFDEPYTGQHLIFYEKAEFSKEIQIDHVVALSDAWQKGAQYKTAEERYAMATDPLNLLAVEASANQQKSDGDAATWLPKNKGFRCQYVARQVSVKYKYGLWVTQAEHDAIQRVLETCPNEPAVGV